MSDAFVQGGVGEVPLSAALALQGKSFWTLDEKKIAADLYERKNPGVTVKRDWETPAQHAARMKARDDAPRPEAAKQSMDPDRARRELLRQQRTLEGLSLEHPDYDRQFDILVEQVHLLEDNCGFRRTEYKKGYRIKKAEESASPELLAKLAEYFKRNDDTRRRSIEAMKNADLLALIRDNETLPELQALAVQRIEQLRAA